MSRKLLALTVLQPFATAIVSWGKPVENRSWAPGGRLPIGSWLAIHAGARDYPGADDEDFRNWIGGLAYHHAPPTQRFHRGYLGALPHGAIVGVARVAGFSDRHVGWSPWAHPEQQHWRFDAVVPFDAPLPCKGAQGLWVVPEDVAADARLAFAYDRLKLREYP